MSRKTLDVAFIFKVSAVLSLSVAYIVQWTTMIGSPSLRTGTDFIIFYTAGRAAQWYGYSSVYNIAIQQKIQESVVGFPLAQGQVLPYNHIPYLVPLLSLLVSANYVASFLRWAALMLIFHAITTMLLVHNLKSASKSTLFAGAMLFFPFFQSLLLGQDTAFLFFGVAIWVVGMIQKKDWLAGIGLAMTSVRPHLCIVLAAPFLFRRQSVLRYFLASITVLILVSLLLLGPNGTLDFLKMLQISAGGTWYGMHQTAMVNLIGMAMRLLPFVQANIIRAAGWGGYFVGIFLAVILWQKEAPLTTKIGVTIILALFFAPHLHSHDLTLLLAPLMFASQSNERVLYLLLGISLLFLLLPFLHYVLPYALYVGLLWMLEKKPNTTTLTMSR
jgi:hypothetical protein